MEIKNGEKRRWSITMADHDKANAFLEDKKMRYIVASR